MWPQYSQQQVMNRLPKRCSSRMDVVPRVVSRSRGTATSSSVMEGCDAPAVDKLGLSKRQREREPNPQATHCGQIARA